MLIRYQQLTRRILNDATFARINDFDLRDYINIGRGQIAIQGDAIFGYGTLAVSSASQQYPFSAIDFGGTPGVKGALALETVNYDVGGGQRPVNQIEWARFNRYELGHAVPIPSQPRVWSQFGQGANGTLWLNALNGPYTLSIKAACYPVDLVDDNTPEALPYMWTDAVPWFAAFYWYAGTGQNQQAAQGALSVFQNFMQMARSGANPVTQGTASTQGGDPFLSGRLGISTGPGRNAQPRQSSPPTAM
jgi:hypothetical protein